MNEQFVLELKKLLNCFPESYINHSLEVILIPKTNTYFFSCRMWYKERHNRKSLDVVY